MKLSNLLLQALANDQASTIIVDSEIMRPVRDWAFDHSPAPLDDLLGCRVCTGTWVAIGQAALGRPSPRPEGGTQPRSILSGAAGLAATALAIASAGLIVTAVRSCLEHLSSRIERW